MHFMRGRDARPGEGIVTAAVLAYVVSLRAAVMALAVSPTTLAAGYFGGFASIAMDANQAVRSAISTSVSGLAITFMTSLERLPLR